MFGRHQPDRLEDMGLPKVRFAGEGLHAFVDRILVGARKSSVDKLSRIGMAHMHRYPSQCVRTPR